MDALAAAVAGLPQPVACGGEILLPAPVTLQLGGGVDVVLDRPSDAELLAPLLARATHAAFGRGRETLRHSNVRDALRSKADAF